MFSLLNHHTKEQRWALSWVLKEETHTDKLREQGKWNCQLKYRIVHETYTKNYSVFIWNLNVISILSILKANNSQTLSKASGMGEGPLWICSHKSPGIYPMTSFHSSFHFSSLLHLTLLTTCSVWDTSHLLFSYFLNQFFSISFTLFLFLHPPL